MSETNAPEPTMEEILASIRRIISEDDAPASAAADAATSPGDPPEPPFTPAAHPPAPHSPAPHADDVLELTERVEPEPPPAPRAPAFHEPEPAAAAPPPRSPATPASLGDLDFDAPPAASPPKPAPAAPGTGPAIGAEEPLVGSGAAGRAADHFGALASSLAMPAQGRTLEDVVRELLRPMLKDWLDQHLPAIVEARVQDEVERISRRRTY